MPDSWDLHSSSSIYSPGIKAQIFHNLFQRSRTRIIYLNVGSSDVFGNIDVVVDSMSAR